MKLRPDRERSRTKSWEVSLCVIRASLAVTAAGLSLPLSSFAAAATAAISAAAAAAAQRLPAAAAEQAADHKT